VVSIERELLAERSTNQPRSEMLAARPRVIFNPTWIPPPSAAMRQHEAAYVASWRSAGSCHVLRFVHPFCHTSRSSAVDSMRSKFLRMAGLHDMWLLRCDAPDPAFGTTQLIGPYSSVSAPSGGPCCVTVSIDRDADNHFGRCSRGPNRERTKLEENTGSCYDVRSFAPPPSASTVPRLAVAAAWVTPNAVAAVYSDGFGVSYNARDGRALASGNVGLQVHGASFARNTAAMWCEGRSLVLAPVEGWEPCARWTLDDSKSCFPCVSWLSESLVLCASSLVDVRTRDGVFARVARGGASVASAAVSLTDGNVFVGLVGGAATFDPRAGWDAPVTFWCSTAHAVRAVDATERWADGARVMSGGNSACVRAAHAPVSSLSAPLVGLANGDALGGRHVFGLHERRIAQLTVADDGFAALAVAPEHCGVALLQFRQNEEKQISLHNGLLLPL
jgi:hypothetical protein